MSEHTIENIQEGESWACKFRALQMVDADGKLVDTSGVQPGEAIDGVPKLYESWGVLETRDLEKQLVQVRDNASGRLITCAWEDCWDVDVVDYVSADTDS
jgi:hypothetical protein